MATLGEMEKRFQARMVGEAVQQVSSTSQWQQGVQEVSRSLPGEDPESVAHGVAARQPLA